MDLDLVSSCKDKLASFRIKELKDVLTKLCLSKQGKKQDLVDRILAILSDDHVSLLWAKKNAVGRDEVAKLVEDTYRKMQWPGATDLASRVHCFSDIGPVKPEEEVEGSFKRIRCICRISLETEPIVKCDDSKCHIWQHIGCVIIHENSIGRHPQIPDPFYCEICRLARADPFWTTLTHPISPMKLTAAISPDGGNPTRSADRSFELTRYEKDMISKPEYDVQAWSVLINDTVPFRMQWPQYPNLQVNGFPVRVVSRPGSQILGTNGRDDGPIITQLVRDGTNKITVTWCDSRVFCFGVRIVKRRTVSQILNMIPQASDGECFGDALNRVCHCIGGGPATENADSDSDIEVVADSVLINLRCPMSGSRMKVAGRFKPCVHMGCFDLNVFVEMNQRSRKWQCPICMHNYTLQHLIIDPFFNVISSLLQSCDEDVTDIEVKPNGSWRPKPGTVVGELGQWHRPDGTLEEEKKTIGRVKDENVSDDDVGQPGLKIGIKKNCNGYWVVKKPDGIVQGGGIPSGNRVTDVMVDGEEDSVNQYSSQATNAGTEIDSAIPLDDVDPLGRDPAELILLTDSDDEAGQSGSTLFNFQDVELGPLWPPPAQESHLLGSHLSYLGSSIGRSTTGQSPLIPESSGCHQRILDGFMKEDAPLQIFLPTQASDGSGRALIRQQGSVPNVIRSKDWISLRIGDEGGSRNCPLPGAEVGAEDSHLSHMAATAASMLMKMNHGVEESEEERHDRMVYFPRQQRSVRPRLYLSIGSDSDSD